VDLLSYVVKRTVTDSPVNTQANCLKCPPSVWMHFLTCVSRELVTLTNHCSVADTSYSAENSLE